MDPSNTEIVEHGDLDEAIRQVDRLTERAAWTDLLDLRDRCRRAVERGHQLWPAASLAEYRLALSAPGPVAAGVVRDGAGLFALGPLAEVAASTHRWAELEPGLDADPATTVVAAERVVRGEDLTDAAAEDGRIDPLVFGVPFALQEWEPAYPPATYRDDEADFPGPPDTPFAAATLSTGASPIEVDDPESEQALRELVRPWVEQSNGVVYAATIEGDRGDALARRTPAAEVCELTPADAMAWMAWTGASGGAHGRRRGMATGRFNAWWAAAALAGFDGWPVDPDALGDAVAELRWSRWRTEGTVTGWHLHLVVESPHERLTWLLDASDHA